MAQKPVNGSDGAVTDPDNRGENRVISIDDDSGEAGIPVIEPTVIAGEPETGEPVRRGRRKGSRNSSGSKQQQKQTGQDLTGILLSAHFLLATIAKVPEIELEEAEARKLGDALARVNALYDGIIFTEKQMAWIQLAMAGGAVYGPRLVVYRARVKQEKRDGKRPVTIDAQKAKVM